MIYLVELNFKSGVHFGSDNAGYGIEQVQGFAHSDTIFSSIINVLSPTRHEFQYLEWVRDFFDNSKSNLIIPFKVSSFGFVDTSQGNHKYYVPKPLIQPNIKINDLKRTDKIKELKQRQFISLEIFQKWQVDELIDLESIVNDEKEIADFWIEETKVQHLTDNETTATQIYHSGMVYYHDLIKPFFLIELDEERFPFNDFKEILKAAQYFGLGGRRTTGSGIFEFTEDSWFPIIEGSIEDIRKINPSFNSQKNYARIRFTELFKAEEPSSYYLFSTLFPQKINEANCVAYDLIPRKGWFFSTSSDAQLKRKSCFMFSEGSVFKNKIDGKLVDVTPEEFKEHKIYRYGIPFYIPYREIKNGSY